MSVDTFAGWLREVDVELEARIGLSYRDLADRPWRDEYDAGTTPLEAALECLADEGLELEDELGLLTLGMWLLWLPAALLALLELYAVVRAVAS